MKFLSTIYRLVVSGVRWLLSRIRKFDRAMRAHYHPGQMAGVAVGAVALLMIVMIFLPPYLGLSNDGSFDRVLRESGLTRLDPDDASAYFNYYERQYRYTSIRVTDYQTPLLQRLLVQTAKDIDLLLTQDDLFDMRFLAAIYLPFYLAALFFLFRSLLSRVQVYSEGLLIALLCVLVFADSRLVVRFASFQTAPMELILLLAMVDTAFSLSDRQGVGFAVPILLVSTVLLMSVNLFCSLAGISMALVFLLLLRQKLSARRKMFYTLCAMLLCVVSVVQTARLVSTQTPEEKYDQMTRGILYQAENPEEALAFFGIEPRYSLLTETYSSQQFPVVLPSSGVLDEGFFDHYGTSDVALYYITHPGALLGLMNIAVHQAFISQSDYSGHYEASVGRPARSKTLFMSIWSRFKEQMAPQSAGFPVVLIMMILLLSRGSKNSKGDERPFLYRLLLGVLAMFCLLELCTVIVISGDSLLMTQAFLMSVCVDVMVLLFVAEVLHKSKLISDDAS